jgi:hypothetical protein
MLEEVLARPTSPFSMFSVAAREGKTGAGMRQVPVSLLVGRGAARLVRRSKCRGAIPGRRIGLIEEVCMEV